jgi:autotransporter-associated beta strand protein
MKPKYHQLFNTAAAVITLSSAAHGQTPVTWNGSTSTDWNNPANWDGGVVPTKTPGNQHAVVNTFATNVATISADIVSPVDIFVGRGAGGNGKLNHTAGVASTGDGNWMFVGTNGGTGVYNLADTNTAGGGLTGFGQGSGSMSAGGRLYIGGNEAGGSNGTVNVNTSGTLVVGSELQVGTGGSTGVLKIENGAVTTNNWTVFGNGAGGNGTLHMTGGSLTKNGSNHFIIADNGSTGFAYVSGGSISVNNEIWVGQAGGSNGTLELSGGTVTNNSWVAVGRDGGTGTVNMTGGTWTKTGGGNFIVGASGPGTMNQSAGLVDVQGGITWMGEGNSATYTLSGTGEFRTSQMILAAEGTSNSTVNLNGGTLRAGQILGGAGAIRVANFNGTQIIATANQGSFISNLSTANVGDGGLKIDTQAFTVASAQNFVSTGTGGLTKSGSGILTLSGANTFAGGVVISGGTLIAGTTASIPGWNTGAISVAAGQGFGASLGVGGFTNGEFDALLSSSAFAAGSSIAINTALGDVTYTDDLGTKTGALTNVGLVKAGANRLFINLANQTFTGGIRLGEGTLVLDHPSSLTYGGQISGGGGLTVQGAGITTLSGTANQVGQLIANGSGALNVAGAGASVTVQGGMIVGDNTAGHVTQSTGLVNVTGGELWIADSAAAEGDYSISGDAVLTVNNWMAVGRRSGKGTLNMTGGTVNKTGGGNLTISTGTGGTGVINQSAGVFNNLNSQTFVGESWNGDGNGTWNLSGTAEANLRDVIIGNGGASTGLINLDGGTLTATRFSSTSTGSRTFNFNGGTLKAGASEAAFMQGLSTANVKSGGARIDTNGFNIGIGQALVDGGGGGGLTKNGAGILTLGGVNTYTGVTDVNTGTLALGAAGSIANSVTINIDAGATLDVSSVSAWSLATSQALTGNGTVNGSATIASGATLSPGNSVGELTFNNDLTLLGTTEMEIQDGTNDMITVLGALTYGGVLDLSNIGGPLTGFGWAPTTIDLFDFNSQSGTFTAINLPTLGAGFSWTSFDYGSGSIAIVPEPSSFIIGGLGVLGLLVRRRRP